MNILLVAMIDSPLSWEDTVGDSNGGSEPGETDDRSAAGVSTVVNDQQQKYK